MTRADRFDNRLEEGLHVLADPHFPDYFDDVLTVTSLTRQRPAWTFPGRWLPMDITRPRAFVPALPWRTIGILVALALLLALAAVIVGSRPNLPPPFGPARNGVIAYESGGDIYVGDPVTGQSRLVVGGSDRDEAPWFSADGTMIAFVRASDILTVRSDGSGLHVLNQAPIADATTAAWAPDGKTLWYSSFENGRHQLHAVQADGSATRIVVTPGLDVGYFEFRPPDGREILFRGDTGSAYGLYSIRPDGSGLRTLVAPDGTPKFDQDMALPRYSPDGSRFAFQHFDQASDGVKLYIAQADGSSRRAIPTAPDVSFAGWPAWSPDGLRIIFQRGLRTPSDPMTFGARDIIVNFDGTGQPVEVGPTLPGSGRDVDFSPDGTMLLMSPHDGGPQVIFPSNGGPVVALPWTSNAAPSWQRLAP